MLDSIDDDVVDVVVAAAVADDDDDIAYSSSCYSYMCNSVIVSHVHCLWIIADLMSRVVRLLGGRSKTPKLTSPTRLLRTIHNRS